MRSEGRRKALSVIHTPETAGAKAVYLKDNGFGTCERDVLGWDKSGRPLVMCGDALESAFDAPFCHHAKFLRIQRPDFAAEFSAILREAIWDSLQAMRDGVEDLDVRRIIRDVVDDVVKRREIAPASNSSN